MDLNLYLSKLKKSATNESVLVGRGADCIYKMKCVDKTSEIQIL